MWGVVYVIKNVKNEKIYVGQTSKDITSRIYQHIKGSKYSNNSIGKAIAKWGSGSFVLLRVIVVNNNFLTEVENEYIKKYNSTHPKGYNLVSGANRSYTKLDAETVYEIKLRLNQTSIPLTQKAIAKMFNIHPNVVCNINTKRSYKNILCPSEEYQSGYWTGYNKAIKELNKK